MLTPAVQSAPRAASLDCHPAGGIVRSEVAGHMLAAVPFANGPWTSAVLKNVTPGSTADLIGEIISCLSPAGP
jgi:hypothetical protein